MCSSSRGMLSLFFYIFLTHILLTDAVSHIMCDTLHKRHKQSKHGRLNERRVKRDLRQPFPLRAFLLSTLEASTLTNKTQQKITCVLSSPSGGECRYYTVRLYIHYKEIQIKGQCTWSSRMNCGNLWIGFIIRPYKVILSALVSWRCCRREGEFKKEALQYQCKYSMYSWDPFFSVF